MENENNRCESTYEIEDECSVLTYRCKKSVGHEGSHETTYPGQWGEIRIPVTWTKDRQRTEFAENKEKC